MISNLAEREMRYQTMIAVSQRMLREGAISKKEFVRIERFLNEKYLPVHRRKMT